MSRDFTGKCELLRAVADPLGFRTLLESCSNGDAANLVDFSGRTCLILAVRRNSIDVVRLLLERFDGKSDFIDRKDIVQCTALSYAAEFGFTEAAELLLQAGTDPATTDCFGNTPIILAAKRGRTGVLRVFGRQVRSLELWQIKGEDLLDARGWADKMKQKNKSDLISKVIEGLLAEDSKVSSHPGKDHGSDGSSAPLSTASTEDGEDLTRDGSDRSSAPRSIASSEAGEDLTRDSSDDGAPSSKRLRTGHQTRSATQAHSPVSLGDSSGGASTRYLTPNRDELHQLANARQDSATSCTQQCHQELPVETDQPKVPLVDASGAEFRNNDETQQLTNQVSSHISIQAGSDTDTDVEVPSALTTSDVGQKLALIISITDPLCSALDEVRQQLNQIFRRCGFDVPENGRSTPQNLVDDLDQMMRDYINSAGTSAAAIGILEFCQLDEQSRNRALSLVSQRPSLIGKPKWIVDQGYALPDGALTTSHCAYLFSNCPADADTNGGYLTRELLARLEPPGALDDGLDAPVLEAVEAVKRASGGRANPRFRTFLDPFTLL